MEGFLTGPLSSSGFWGAQHWRVRHWEGKGGSLLLGSELELSTPRSCLPIPVSFLCAQTPSWT